MSVFFWNGFWVFLGIVAGALIQYLLGTIVRREQRSNARKLFKVETQINRRDLNKLGDDLRKKKEKCVAGVFEDADHFIDMASFNYRMLDPLINSGYFHDLLDVDGVSDYFRFANSLNINYANNLSELLKEKHQESDLFGFLEWLVETKLVEWDHQLSRIEEKLGVK